MLDHSEAGENKIKLFEIKKFKTQKKWTKDEDKLLISLAKTFNCKNWKTISGFFLDKSPLQCFSRYKRIRPGIVKGSWTKEEDSQILDLVGKYGKSWSKISKILSSRNGKQIRDRYLNILDPSVHKGKFSMEEDIKLLGLYKKHGPKWANISKYFEKRTADMIKNRFHSSIKKNMKFLEDMEIDSSKNLPQIQENLFHSVSSTGLISNTSPEQNDIFSSLSCSNEYEAFALRSFANLKIDNVISFDFILEKPSRYSEEDINAWQIDDYFNL